jgi:hypothetical protein
VNVFFIVEWKNAKIACKEWTRQVTSCNKYISLYILSSAIPYHSQPQYFEPTQSIVKGLKSDKLCSMAYSNYFYCFTYFFVENDFKLFVYYHAECIFITNVHNEFQIMTCDNYGIC